MSAWSIESSTVISDFSVNPENGLSNSEVEKRLHQFGPNSITITKKNSRWFLLFKQLNNPVVYVLILALILAFILKEHLDGWAILAIVILNALFGFFQESKAEASIEALAAMASPKGKVLREGKIISVDSKTICPGDILILEAGDYVVADARIILANQLFSNESILTGESLPVQKQSDPIDETSPMAERSNMLFASTAISGGTGRAIVVSTGQKTEVGKIAEMIDTTKLESTPIQIRLEKVSKNLLYMGFVIIVIVFAIGYFQKREFIDVLMTALSLSIAAIPEGLPTVVTVTLVMAVHHMTKKRALVRKLDSVETLGTTDIICTDKTGTLTTGKMEVREKYTRSIDQEEHLIQNMVFCNNASLEGSGSGDTTELALLEYVQKNSDKYSSLVTYPRLFEWSFDSKRKRMSVAIKYENKIFIYVKGAPESVLSKCNLNSVLQNELSSKVSEFSKKGMRVLAFAFKETAIDDFQKIHSDEIEKELHFTGLVAMADPPRHETIPAIIKCQKAGIRIIMITGDHPLTAAAIAFELGITTAVDERVVSGIEMDSMSDEELKNITDKVSVYARFSPENKLKLVNALKSKGHVVAMTGDGVNDAPALKAASIGVAMGKGGTEVARQASSMILTDDNFATIVDAVEEGRAVNGNIKRTLQYLLSTNLAELLFILGATIVGMPIPLLPINILWLNLATDGFPSLALAAEKVPPHFLEESNKPSVNTFFDRAFYQEMLIVGFIITLLCLAVYSYGLKHFDIITARSLAFSFIVYIVLLRSFSCRSEQKTFFEMKPNFYHFLAVFIPLIFQLSMQRFNFFLEIFKVKSLPLKINLVLLGLATLPVFLIETYKIVSRKKS